MKKLNRVACRVNTKLARLFIALLLAGLLALLLVIAFFYGQSLASPLPFPLWMPPAAIYCVGLFSAVGAAVVSIVMVKSRTGLRPPVFRLVASSLLLFAYTGLFFFVHFFPPDTCESDLAEMQGHALAETPRQPDHSAR